MSRFVQKLNQKLNDLYLKKKLVILYSLCGILPTLILSVFLIFNTGDRLLRLSDSQIRSENMANRSMLLSLTNLVSALSKIIVSDEDLTAIITGDYEDETAVYSAYRNFTVLDEICNNYAEIADIRLFISNDSLFSVNRYQIITDETRQSTWYQNISESSSDLLWFSGTSFSPDANLYLLRRITIPQSDNYAILLIGVSNNYLSSMNFNRMQDTYLFLGDTPVFFSTSGAHSNETLNYTLISPLEKYDSQLCSLDGQKLLAYETTLKNYASTQTFHIVTTSNDIKDITNTLIYITIIILIVTLLPLFLFVAFSNQYSDRLLTIRREMHKISHGELNLEANVVGTDELGELYEDMQTTLAEIQALHRQILTEQKEKDEFALKQQKLQFEILANQINPHFLFNTLETIRMHALLSNQPELDTIIMKLGQTLRYALDTSSTTTTLERVLEYIQAYLDIQHFRFQDKLNYTIDISPDLNQRNMIMLPFLLQPIVENAINHGFSTKKKGGRITISATRAGDLVTITVEDNGCGIAPDRLAELNNKLSTDNTEVSSDHIGMHNANNRIKLFYGMEYGIRLDSTENVGTLVTIKLPYREV